MKLYVRCAILLLAALALAGCQTNDRSRKVGGGVSKSISSSSWNHDYGNPYVSHEPSSPTWASRVPRSRKHSRSSSRRKRGSIRSMARRLAPAGTNPSRLSRMVGKRRSVRINCLPTELRMMLNTVAWHYGKRVHIQSGYRSRRHNRRVGGAKRSYHVLCQAVDIQVRGVNKYTLAKFLKSLPGRGGVGTYCSTSTVHIDVGPRRQWHYGCRKKRSKRRYARRKSRRR